MLYSLSVKPLSVLEFQNRSCLVPEQELPKHNSTRGCKLLGTSTWIGMAEMVWLLLHQSPSLGLAVAELIQYS